MATGGQAARPPTPAARFWCARSSSLPLSPIPLTLTRASRDTMVTRTSGRARHSSAAAAEAAMPAPTMTTAAAWGRGGEGVRAGWRCVGGAVGVAAGGGCVDAMVGTG